MKILTIIPSMKRGGAERVASRLTAEWAKKNKVVLLLYDDGGPMYPYGGHRLCLDRAARAGWWRKAFTMFIRTIQIAQVMRRFEPDRVITFMEAASLPALFAATMLGKRDGLVLSVHNNPGRFPKIYQLVIPLLYRFAHAIVAVSEGIENVLANEYGVPRERLRHIPNPIDVTGAREAAERITDRDDRERFILAVGRLHPQKGYDMLLRAYAKVKDRVQRPLVILGDGPERASLAKLAEALHVAEDVRLAGSVEKPFEVMAAADLLVVSSRYEGWPVALAEAMACGCPAVSFNCNFGPAEIIEHGKSGLLVAPENVDELAERVAQVMEDGALRKRLAEGAAEGMKPFDVAVVAPRWLET